VVGACGRCSKSNPLEVHHIFEWAACNLPSRVKVRWLQEALEFLADGCVASTHEISPPRVRLAQAKAAPWWR
jgi:hypothetical protein